MPNLLGMSFERPLAPSVDLHCVQTEGVLPDGWGIGYYPGTEPCASVLKEPAPPRGSIRSELVKAWEHVESSTFLLHIRTATWGPPSDANTQPFLRSMASRDWLFAHASSLRSRMRRTKGRFEPVGSTDTELVFCDLLELLAERGARHLSDIDPEELRRWFAACNDHGTLSVLVSDGRDLCAYADKNDELSLHLWQLRPPFTSLAFGDRDLTVDLMKRGDTAHKGVVISSCPLTTSAGPPADFTKLEPGHLVIVRQGSIVAEAKDTTSSLRSGSTRPALFVPVARPERKEPRRLAVRHRTVYRYDAPVERSSHLLRLLPIHDPLQTVRAHALTISVDGQRRDYEDVFGNRVTAVRLETPFQELIIEARSEVDVLDVDPLSFRPLYARSHLPLVWMPWQGAMLQPFLLPPELPESELRELVGYAMSFAERNEFDLLDTLLDMNQSIYREYEYRPQSTNLATTAFDVYAHRRGVCQDFTNLFICLARLLGVPARYVCGYLYTGPKHENRLQAEASHAWVQLYLPEVGWKGFDPTNGVLTQTDHVRLAVGRNYRDATPTSGTIYLGGGREHLEVSVTVEPLAVTGAPIGQLPLRRLEADEQTVRLAGRSVRQGGDPHEELGDVRGAGAGEAGDFEAVLLGEIGTTADVAVAKIDPHRAGAGERRGAGRAFRSQTDERGHGLEGDDFRRVGAAHPSGFVSEDLREVDVAWADRTVERDLGHGAAAFVGEIGLERAEIVGRGEGVVGLAVVDLSDTGRRSRHPRHARHPGTAAATRPGGAAETARRARARVTACARARVGHRATSACSR
jgi:transglutaminase-like putative cysteine protease/predicted glutamine amidotransferase